MADFRARIEAFVDTSKAAGDLNSFVNQQRKVDVEVNLKLNQASQALHNLLQQMQNTGGNAGTQFAGQFVSAINSGMQQINASQIVNQVDKQTNKLTVNIRNNMRDLTRSAKVFNETTAKTFGNQMTAWARNNGKAVKAYGDRLNDLQTRLNTAISNKDAGAVKQVREEFRLLQSEARATGNIGKTFAQSFTSSLGSVAKFAASYVSIYRVFDELKQGVQTVVELDNALVDLQKTSNATPQQLNSFYREANSIAKEYGTTTKQIIQGAADWSRLGYNLQDSKTMSRLSAQFSAISPGMSVDEATTGLVSTMKAFGIEADGVLDGIMSKVNAVGNGFALTNADIINGLENSSSAMAVANNTLDETVALITAGTEIVQDASKVGNGLRTISMRIRGMNEETEELDDNLVNIKGDVYELTGGKVSIMEDEDTYKSTYQVLKEISDVWDDLSDKNQAQLLDKLFGKTRAQIGAAIIQNFSQADKAMETMANSAGDADRELGIITKSLEYKINAFKETATGIFQGLFQREDVGAVVDFGTQVLELFGNITDKLGLVKTTIAGLALGGIGKNLLSTFKDLSIAGEINGLTSLLSVIPKAFPNVSALATSIGQLFSSLLKGQGVLTSLGNVFSSFIGLVSAHPFFALAAGVGVALFAFDALNESVDEANSSMQSAFDEYANAKEKTSAVFSDLQEIESKMDALSEKKGLTFIEDGELANLSQAAELLREQYKLAQLEEEQAAKKAADSAVHAYNKAYGKYGELTEEAVQEAYDEYDIRPSYNDSNETDLVTGLAELRVATEKKNEAYNKCKDYLGEDYESLDYEQQEIVDDYQFYSEIQEATTNQLRDQLTNLVDYKSKLDSLGFDNLNSDQKAMYNEVENAIGMVWEAIDPAGWKQLQYDKIFDHNKLRQAKNDMLDLANANDDIGISIEDVQSALDKRTYQQLSDELDKAGFSMQDFVDNINSEANVRDLDTVHENIIEETEKAVNEAKDKIHGKGTTIEPEVEVEPKVTVLNDGDELEKYNEWVRGLNKEYTEALETIQNDATIDTSGWDTADFQNAVEGIVNGTEDVSESVIDLKGDLSDLQFAFGDSGGLTQAITDYKTQMTSLMEARDKWNNGEFQVSDMIDLQTQFNQLNGYDMSNFGKGLERQMELITGSIDESYNGFQDFKNQLIKSNPELAKSFEYIDGFSELKRVFDGVDPHNEEFANNIISEAKKLGIVDSETAKNSSELVDSIKDSYKASNKATGIMGAFAKAIDKVGGEGTSAGKALVTMRDNLIGLYNVADKTTSAYDSIKTQVASFSEYQTTLSNALKSSRSATGLTTEEIEKLSAAYKDIEGFNPAKLFEKTYNGVHLNQQELKRLNDEVRNSTLSQMYEDLAKKQAQLNEARRSNGDTSGLENDIAQAQLLIAQYEGLTSAYNAWLAAKSGGNERDSYESLGKSSHDDMQKILDAGWTNDSSLNAYLDLMLSASQRTDDAYADFEKLNQLIGNTGKSLRDFWTYDENGTLTTDGLYDMLDVVDSLDDSLVDIKDDGTYAFDWTGDKLQRVADLLGTTPELLQLMERAMIEAGMDVEIGGDSFAEQIENAKQNIESLQSAGELSRDIDLSIDVETAPLDEVKASIDSLKDARAEIDVEANPEAASALDELINKCEQQYYLRLNVESDGALDTAVQDVLRIQEIISQVQSQNAVLSVNAIVNGNAEIESLAEEIASLPPEVQIAVGVSEENVGSVQGIIDQLSQDAGSINVPVNYTEGDSPDTVSDASGTANYELGDSPTTVPDTSGIANYSLGDYPTTVPSAHGVANFSLGSYPTSLPPAHQTVYRTFVDQKATGTMTSISRARSSGSFYNVINYKNAYADGRVALPYDEIALVNELGQESIIRDGKWMLLPPGMHQQELKKGDIILSAKQTKALLNTGVAIGRGRAYANGTLSNAYDSGSGGKRRPNSSPSSGSSGSSGGGATGSNSYSGSGYSGGGYSGGGSSGGSDELTDTPDSSSEDKPEYFDWIEIKLDRIQRRIKNLKDSAEDTFRSWSKRTASLSQEISAVTTELSLQQQAYDRYIQQANSIGLSDDLKALVRDGSIDVTQYSDDIQELIQDYKEFYEKALDCKDAIHELNLEQKELFEQQFDNIVTKWENSIQNILHSIENKQSAIALRNAKSGDYALDYQRRNAYTKNTADYRSMIALDQEQIDKRKKELAELQAQLQRGVANGTIQNASEEYYKLLAEIQSVETEINNLNNEIIDFGNSISEEFVKLFSSISQSWDNACQTINHSNEILLSGIERRNARASDNNLDYLRRNAYEQNINAYERLIANSQAELIKKQNKRTALQALLNQGLASGEIVKNTPKYFELLGIIQEIDNEINDLNTDIIEYTNSMSEEFAKAFQNIRRNREYALQTLEHDVDRTENRISRRNAYASDYVSSDEKRDAARKNIKDYTALITNSERQIAKKEAELSELYTKLNEGIASGLIQKDTPQYFELLSIIEQVENEIDNLNEGIIENSNNISNQYKIIFDSLSKDSENRLSLISHLQTTYNNALKLTQLQGYATSAAYYEKLKQLESQKIEENKTLLKQLQDALVEAVASGEIEIGSQAWYDMSQRINQTTESIEESTLAMQEFNNAIRNLEWEKFDFLQSQLEVLIQEGEFLVSLFDNSVLFNESGSATLAGKSASGLHAMNYNLYQYLGQGYGDERKKIESQLKNDPYNKDLINRRNQLLGLQQRAIQSANSEKAAIANLVRDGIEKETASMRKLIAEYENALDAQKSLYEYQKKINRTTDDISKLRKQLSAYANDTSEEARAKIQKIQVQLKEKDDELEQAAYDKMISDTKRLLDKYYSDYEESQNSRMDNVDSLVQGVIDTTNMSKEDIGRLIIQLAEENGYEITDEMRRIWDPDGELTDVVGELDDHSTTIFDVVSDIKTGVDKVYSATENVAKAVGEITLNSQDPDMLFEDASDFDDPDQTNPNNQSVHYAKTTTRAGTKDTAQDASASTTDKPKLNSTTTTKKSTTTTTKKSTTTTTKKSTTTTTKKPTTTTTKKVTTTTKKPTTTQGASRSTKDKYGVALAVIMGKYGWSVYPERKTKLEQKGFNYDEIQGIISQLWSDGYVSNGTWAGKYHGITDLTPYSYANMAKGAKRVGRNQLAWTNENWDSLGGETIVRASDHAVLTPLGSSDRIYSAMASSHLWDAANNPARYIAQNMPTIHSNNNDSHGVFMENHFENITFEFPNVKNYDELVRQMQSDNKFERLVQSMTLGRINGKSANNKYKINFSN